MKPPAVLAHAGELHLEQWLAIAGGALVPLIAIFLVFALTNREDLTNQDQD